MQANLDQATTQDFVLTLSAIGHRISMNKPNARDLIKGQHSSAFEILDTISAWILQKDSLKDAKFNQVATILWVYSLVISPRYSIIWDELSKRIE